MFKSISTAGFFTGILILASIYYIAVLILYYRKEIAASWRRQEKNKTTILLAGLLIGRWASAQTADGNTGISQANTLVRSYFDTGTQLMYGVGAIIGLIGAVRVFKLWIAGHREDVGQAAAGWFGACIFLVIVATVIKSFFGL